MCRHFTPEPRTRFLGSLYLGGVESVQAELRTVPAEARTILLLGHNPGWEMCLQWLTGETGTLKTANAALLEGEGKTWPEALQRDAWNLIDTLRPKKKAK